MSDLEQLERNADYNLGFDDGLAIGRSEAADRLRQYREALEYYAKWHPQPSEGPWGADSTDFGEIARTALKETTDVD